MQEIVQIISTVGFPIVAVIGMATFFYRMWIQQTEQNEKREEMLMDLIRELSTNLADLGRIVDENTKVLAVLTEKVETLENKIDREL